MIGQLVSIVTGTSVITTRNIRGKGSRYLSSYPLHEAEAEARRAKRKAQSLARILSWFVSQIRIFRNPEVGISHGTSFWRYGILLIID